MNTEFASLFKLARAQRLQLVSDLWDSIEQEEADPTVSATKVAELRRRKERFMLAPETGRTWEQVRERARRGHE